MESENVVLSTHYGKEKASTNARSRHKDLGWAEYIPWKERGAYLGHVTHSDPGVQRGQVKAVYTVPDT